MILAADRCTAKAPAVYVADDLDEIVNIINPNVGDVALSIGPGLLDAWRLTDNVLEPDGFEVIQSNRCEYIWQHAGEFVNVALFGATPNGGTDQTDAFTAAVEAAPEGATLFVPPGTYILNGFVIDKNLSLYLASGAILQMRSQATASMLTWTANAQGGFYGWGVVDGNKAGQTQATWYPVVKTLTDTHFTVTNLIFRNCAYAAIQDVLSTGTLEIASCKFMNAAQHGGVTTVKTSMHLYLGAYFINVHDCSFAQDDYPDNSGQNPGGILVAGDYVNRYPRVNISNNTFRRVGMTYLSNHIAPIHIYQSCDGIVIKGNIIREPLWDAILVQNSSHAIVSANVIHGLVGNGSLCAVGIWFNPTIRDQTAGPGDAIISENTIQELPLAIGVYAYAATANAGDVQILNNNISTTLHGIRVSGETSAGILFEGPVLISGNTVRPTGGIGGYGIRVEEVTGTVNVVNNDVRATISHALWAITGLELCRLHLDGNYLKTETAGFYGATLRGMAGLYIHSGTFSNTGGGGNAYTVNADADGNNVLECMIESDEVIVEAGSIVISTAGITAWARSTITLAIDPNGNVQAPVGARFVRTNGGAGTTFYVKEGALITNWVGK